MSKKVTEAQKKEIINAFISGKSTKEIAIFYGFTVNTITRQIKKIIGEKEFYKIKNSDLSNPKNTTNESTIKENIYPQQDLNNGEIFNNKHENNFYEIKPLTDFIELDKQKEISSQSLNDIKFPNIVYIVIEKEIEIKPKLLYEFPDWRFLPKEDLERYAIEIFHDQKEAKRSCTNNQKLLKVPNPNVFLIASKKMKAKGITRLVYGEKLIAL